MTREYARKRRECCITKGFDYRSLADLWGVELGDGMCDWIPVRKFLRGVLQDHFVNVACFTHDACQCRLSVIAEDLRVYLRTLSKSKMSYCGPAWAGLSRVKDDYTLIQLAIPLIGSMWE